MIPLKEIGDKEKGLAVIFGPILLNSLNFSSLSRNKMRMQFTDLLKEEKGYVYVCVCVCACMCMCVCTCVRKHEHECTYKTHFDIQHGAEQHGRKKNLSKLQKILNYFFPIPLLQFFKYLTMHGIVLWK